MLHIHVLGKIMYSKQKGSAICMCVCAHGYMHAHTHTQTSIPISLKSNLLTVFKSSIYILVCLHTLFL